MFRVVLDQSQLITEHHLVRISGLDGVEQFLRGIKIGALRGGFSPEENRFRTGGAQRFQRLTSLFGKIGAVVTSRQSGNRFRLLSNQFRHGFQQTNGAPIIFQPLQDRSQKQNRRFGSGLRLENSLQIRFGLKRLPQPKLVDREIEAGVYIVRFDFEGSFEIVIGLFQLLLFSEDDAEKSQSESVIGRKLDDLAEFRLGGLQVALPR